MVGVDAAIASVLSELQSISLLEEEQWTTLKAFLDGTDVFNLLPAGFGKILIYQLTPLVIWFVDQIGKSQSTIDGDTDRWFIQSPAKYFVKCLLFSKRFPMEPSPMVVCNKPSGVVRFRSAKSPHACAEKKQKVSEHSHSLCWP